MPATEETRHREHLLLPIKFFPALPYLNFRFSDTRSLGGSTSRGGQRVWNIYRNEEGEGYVVPYHFFKGHYSECICAPCSGPIQWQHNHSDLNQQSKIKAVMSTIEQNSCLKFVERTGDAQATDYVYIINSKEIIRFKGYDKGCATQVGRQDGANGLYLNSVNCLSNRTIFHELFHKLGMQHEHCRYDRDHYIYIDYTRLPTGKLAMWIKMEQAERQRTIQINAPKPSSGWSPVTTWTPSACRSTTTV